MTFACRNCFREIPDGSAYCPSCGAAQIGPKKLFRSSTDAKLLGVCGGFGEFWDTDPTVIRVAYTVLTFLTGILPGIVLYVVLAIIMPKRPFSA
ncbi:MAG: PspC domain-containing protein [Thermoanaerobaculum sp.]